MATGRQEKPIEGKKFSKRGFWELGKKRKRRGGSLERVKVQTVEGGCYSNAAADHDGSPVLEQWIETGS